MNGTTRPSLLTLSGFVSDDSSGDESTEFEFLSSFPDLVASVTVGENRTPVSSNPTSSPIAVPSAVEGSSRPMNRLLRAYDEQRRLQTTGTQFRPAYEATTPPSHRHQQGQQQASGGNGGSLPYPTRFVSPTWTGQTNPTTARGLEVVGSAYQRMSDPSSPASASESDYSPFLSPSTEPFVFRCPLALDVDLWSGLDEEDKDEQGEHTEDPAMEYEVKDVVSHFRENILGAPPQPTSYSTSSSPAGHSDSKTTEDRHLPLFPSREDEDFFIEQCDVVLPAVAMMNNILPKEEATTPENNIQPQNNDRRSVGNCGTEGGGRNSSSEAKSEGETEEKIAVEDIQGIPWSTMDITRERYQLHRALHYQSFTNLSFNRELVDFACDVPTSSDARFYDILQSDTSISPSASHFQLRHVVRCPAEKEVYYLEHNLVKRWNPALRESECVMRSSLAQLEAEAPPNICSLLVAFGIIFAGGMCGELVAKSLRSGVMLRPPGRTACVTSASNSICNALEAKLSRAGAPRLLCSNNDNFIKEFDIPSFKEINHFPMDWAVNHSVASHDRNLLCVVGDNTDALVIDAQSGKSIHRLKGHADFNFSCAWHPNGYTVATGNQDRTCRVWDLRKPNMSVKCLPASIGAVRSVSFSHSGDMLVFGEDVDFLHLYSVDSNYEETQRVDFFGEIPGFSFSPNDSSLFFGIGDISYGCMVELSKSSSKRSSLETIVI